MEDQAIEAAGCAGNPRTASPPLGQKAAALRGFVSDSSGAIAINPGAGGPLAVGDQSTGSIDRPRHFSIERQSDERHDFASDEAKSAWVGRLLPDLVLPSWPSASLNLLKRWRESSVLLSTHPGTADPDRCDERLLAWATAADTLNRLGYEIALLSTDPVESTRTTIELLGVPFTTIADDRLALARALRLPTTNRFGSENYAELTLVVHEGEVGHVFRANPTTAVRSDVEIILGSLREVHG
jgi:peroxiredoxin